MILIAPLDFLQSSCEMQMSHNVGTIVPARGDSRPNVLGYSFLPRVRELYTELARGYVLGPSERAYPMSKKNIPNGSIEPLGI